MTTVSLQLPTMDSLDDVTHPPANAAHAADRQHSAASEYAFGRTSEASSEVGRRLLTLTLTLTLDPYTWPNPYP